MDANRKKELLCELQPEYHGTPIKKIYLENFENGAVPEWIRFAADKEQIAAELNQSLQKEIGKRHALEKKLKEIHALAG